MDIRKCAQQRAHKMVFDYIDSGADDELALQWANDAYNKKSFSYKVLSGVSPPIDLNNSVGNIKFGLPFFNCPTAGNRMFHSEGELAVAKTAEKFKTMYSISSLCTTKLDKIKQIHSGPKVFQLYVWKDRHLLKDVIQLAKENNYNILALTADFTWYGNRERDKKNGFTIPPSYSMNQVIEALKKPAWTLDYLMNPNYNYACLKKDAPAESLAHFVNSQICPEFNWKDAEWVLGEWNHGPTALKGVVRTDDAKMAIETGFDIIWISNHGGRQLETSIAPFEALQKIKPHIGNTPIILDGGVRRGIDIVKAISLGADAVGIGKPYLYGLAAGGQNGVERVYEILIDEIQRAMGLLGVSSIAELKKNGHLLVN
jgi:isopentenyl diphosphate isomerase/L-lactate dehydrogenase-like FMN-dependent dehydrogenase